VGWKGSVWERYGGNEVFGGREEITSIYLSRSYSCHGGEDFKASSTMKTPCGVNFDIAGMMHALARRPLFSTIIEGGSLKVLQPYPHWVQQPTISSSFIIPGTKGLSPPRIHLRFIKHLKMRFFIE
jgi:hypothetical protein